MNTRDTLPELSDTVGSDQVTSLPEDPKSTEKDTLSGHITDGGTLSTGNGQVVTGDTLVIATFKIPKIISTITLCGLK